MCDDNMNINKEIATLLNLPNSPFEAVLPSPDGDEHVWPELKTLRRQRGDQVHVKGHFRRVENVVWREWFVRSISPPSPSSPTEKENSFQNKTKIIVHGKDAGDIPAEYETFPPKRHEMLAIGTHIDTRITPGFFYKVRINGSEKYQFKGNALRLQSIGKGYGKRFTFASKCLNANKNYFWSDSHNEGYAFSIQVVFNHEEFGIYDAQQRHIGRAVVEFVSDAQNEIEHVEKDGAFEKTVRVTMRCNVDIKCGPHGMVSLISNETLSLEGKAIVIKAQKSAKAVTKCIEDVEIPPLGRCTLRSDE
ncbi:uncharacterized protein LOC144432674 [Glandiceps talaboti]